MKKDKWEIVADICYYMILTMIFGAGFSFMVLFLVRELGGVKYDIRRKNLRTCKEEEQD